MPFVEDFAPYFIDFGVNALIGAATVRVIFDRAFIASMNGQVDATEPMCVIKSSDVTAQALVFGSAITISGIAYKVRGIQPDGTGITTLMLELA